MPDPVTPAIPPDSTGGGELQPFAGRWQIEANLALGVWTADYESEDGTSRRVVIGRSATELVGKLTVIEAAQ